MIGAVQDLAAEALFVSDMQPSECPSQHDIELAILAMLLCYGSDGCAAECAAEFGDHPEAAVQRMYWARSELACINALPVGTAVEGTGPACVVSPLRNAR